MEDDDFELVDEPEDVKPEWEVCDRLDDFEVDPLPEVKLPLGDLKVEESFQNPKTVNYASEEVQPVAKSLAMQFQSKVAELSAGRMKVTLSAPSQAWIDKLLKRYKTYKDWEKDHPGMVSMGFGEAFKLLFRESSTSDKSEK